jgi:hypothetical protein
MTNQITQSEAATARYLGKRVILYLILSVGPAILGAIVFQSQFWRSVNCNDGQVFTVIYNNSRISEIKNAREVAYSRADEKRTCTADAVVGNLSKKLTFVIDTSRRGQPNGQSYDKHIQYNKFSISYQLHD